MQAHEQAVAEGQREHFERIGRALHVDDYPRICFPAW
jgi:hypothetical protein